MPAPHHSVFYRPDALPVAQPTASKQLKAQRNGKTPNENPKEMGLDWTGKTQSQLPEIVPGGGLSSIRCEQVQEELDVSK